MSANNSSSHSPSDGEYEDLLGLWSDLEASLSVLLVRPQQVHDFATKVRQFDCWLQDLVVHDIDAALYLMFQLAATSTVGYSASHALVCGTLCHIMALEIKLPPDERDSLVRAALTMNIGMTTLQNELAEQRDRPNSAQQDAIKGHGQNGRDMLERLFIKDRLWLDVVAQHHTSVSIRTPLAEQSPQDRLIRILGTIDRYAAMISPRKSRVGRSVTDSVRAIMGQEIDQRDEVGLTLVRAIGLCPPGTFVKLDNGETGIVLRRSAKANHPLVASLEDDSGAHHALPSLYHTATGKPRIQSALARSAVSMDLNHRTMVRLGLYAAKRGVGLRGLVSSSGHGGL
jgi:hypothetical protein